MRITRLVIENFRSIRYAELHLGETTVFIGPNNAGKSAIIDAIRIVLTRRWGQRGTGFTENDIHRPHSEGDPRTLPPVRITLVFEELGAGEWDGDMVAALEDIMTLTSDGRNRVALRVTCAWSVENEVFEPAWQFLDGAGQPLPERRRAINLTGFFNYVPVFWLGALRDAADEFTPRSGHWSRLLKGVRIPDALEAEVLEALARLDAQIVAADPRLSDIADLIGRATRVAIGEGPGAARLATLPLAIEEMIQRTGIVLRNEAMRPWLPLSHHGHGLQSLAVIFLFQAAVLQQIGESDRPGTEAIFAIEEPEAHLHPQAARTLWDHVQELTGQRVLTSHSPHFVQHVPLRDLRLARLRAGCTEVASLPQHVISDLPWNPSLDGLMRSGAGNILFRDAATGRVAARSWFDTTIGQQLASCYRRDANPDTTAGIIARFRRDCRIMPTSEDEDELGLHGRRSRGEIFFARRWVIVEGISEFLLVHALGRALGCALDHHGIALIDFTQSGSAGVYPALAEAFGIPWSMIVDGDAESAKFRRQLLDRGFDEDDLRQHFQTLPVPHDLEDQMLADGHEALLREVLASCAGRSALTCSREEFVQRLKNKKSGYMNVLAPRVARDPALAAQMPAPFVNLITNLREAAQ